MDSSEKMLLDFNCCDINRESSVNFAGQSPKESKSWNLQMRRLWVIKHIIDDKRNTINSILQPKVDLASYMKWIFFVCKHIYEQIAKFLQEDVSF